MKNVCGKSKISQWPPSSPSFPHRSPQLSEELRNLRNFHSEPKEKSILNLNFSFYLWFDLRKNCRQAEKRFFWRMFLVLDINRNYKAGSNR